MTIAHAGDPDPVKRGETSTGDVDMAVYTSVREMPERSARRRTTSSNEAVVTTHLKPAVSVSARISFAALRVFYRPSRTPRPRGRSARGYAPRSSGCECAP